MALIPTLSKTPPAFPSPAGEKVLSHAQAGREVVQEFCPLAESLEWELGQQYLRERGTKAFIGDSNPIPFIINNDGTLSRNAAEVFFASLVAAEKTDALEEDIFVLELGVGVGLFARYFLDHFKDLCLKHRQDYYDRLCYVAADRSEQMLLDLTRHGVLANHPGRYCVRQVDALNPEGLVTEDLRFRRLKGKPFRAVFLNYLLDCLPAAVLERDGDNVKQLCVRTCVARNIKLSDHTDMTVGQLQERAKAMDARSRQELLEVYGLFASEYDYRPVNVKTLPYGAFALEYARKRTKKLLVNFGAMQCLEKLLPMLGEGGFILMNEYGSTQLDAEWEFEHQRFSFATAVGLNLPLLKAYFESPVVEIGRQNHEEQNHNAMVGQTGRQNHGVQNHNSAGGLTGESEGVEGKSCDNKGRCQWFEPFGDSRGIHTRLAGNNVSSDTVTRFYERFSDAAEQALHDPIEKARMCLKSGRFELASGFYKEALRLQPRNWVLLNEISSFLTSQMHDPKWAIDMAKVALAQNPTCSAELWNTLGDALFEFGRTREACSAYQRALAVNSTDVRSRYNLGWVYAREKNYPTAVRWLADALALDKTGQYGPDVMKKLNEVLGQLSLRHQTEYLLLINLVSRYAKPDDKKEI